MKFKTKFFRNTQNLAKLCEVMCKNDPVFKQEHDRLSKQRRCAATHKNWLEDRDVHGHLGYYCADCGVWQSAYSVMNSSRESYMTCEEIKKS